MLTLGKTKLIAKKHTHRKIWMYKRANFDEANTTLQCIPSFCLPANDIDSLRSQWYSFFMSTMSTFIPTKSIKPNQRLPYITDSLKRDIQRKLKLYKEPQHRSRLVKIQQQKLPPICVRPRQTSSNPSRISGLPTTNSRQRKLESPLQNNTTARSSPNFLNERHPVSALLPRPAPPIFPPLQARS